MIVPGLTVRAINGMIAFRQLSVSNLGTTSIRTALTGRHVKRQHYRFPFFRPTLTVKWLNLFTTTFLKAVEVSNHSSGRSAITGVIFYKPRCAFDLSLSLMQSHYRIPSWSQ